MENLTRDKLKALRTKFNLTQTECANLIYVSLRTWQRYETADARLPQAKQELLLIKLAQIKNSG